MIYYNTYQFQIQLQRERRALNSINSGPILKYQEYGEKRLCLFIHIAYNKPKKLIFLVKYYCRYFNNPVI